MTHHRSTKRHTFLPQMAQGAANPNLMQCHEIPVGGYQNQHFTPNPNLAYDQAGGGTRNMGYQGKHQNSFAAQVEALVERLVGDNSRRNKRQIGQKPYP